MGKDIIHSQEWSCLWRRCLRRALEGESPWVTLTA